MKKSVLFLTIFLCAVSVFAGTIGGANTPITTNAQATVKVVLNLKQADISAYRFGFSSDNPSEWMTNQDINVIPTRSPSPISLVFDGDTGKASLSSTLFVYYKTRTVENYEIRIDISDGLTFQGNKVDWTVKIGEEKTLDSSISDLYWCKSINANSPTNLLKAGIYPLTMETALINTAMVDGTYEGTITCTITAKT